jgi:hypothetical protein
LDRVPALWRRIADLGPRPPGIAGADPAERERRQPEPAEVAEEAATRFYGSLDGTTVPPMGWDAAWPELIEDLAMVATYWDQIVVEASGWHFAPPLAAVRDRPEIRRVYAAQTALIDAGLIVPRVNVTTVESEVTPLSLRAAIWSDLGRALAHGLPYKRCHQCGLWFSPTRANATLCSSTCKQHAYYARQVTEAAEPHPA